MIADVEELTDETLDQTLVDAASPILIHFWAAWCAPCRMLASTVENVKEKFGGKLRVAKINVDLNPEASRRYGVKAIPLLIVFKGGHEVLRNVGTASETSIERLLATQGIHP